MVDGSTTRTFSTSYEYDGNNQVKKITYPSGRVVNYTRWANGTIKKITATFNGTTQTVINNAAYEPFGPVKSFVYGNGLLHTRLMDEGYRISDVGLFDTASFDTYDWYVYGRDAAGNVTSAEDPLYTQQSTNYGYDVLNRLTWDSGVSSASPTYSYDGNGNRLSRSATQTPFSNQTLNYVANSNRLDVLNSGSISHDGMGNVTTLGSRTLTYGASGRLASLSDSNTTTTLNAIYNGQGELARTVHNTVDGCSGLPLVFLTEYYTFAPDGRVLQIRAENLSRTHQEIIWLDDLPVAQFQDSFDSSGTYQNTELTYLHPDQLGTPRLGTDASKQIVFRYRSDAFGNPIELTGRVVRLRFPGQFTLGVGDIHYNYFRDYDPRTGRYLESDPIGLEGGINTYAYALLDPVSLYDPYGLWVPPSIPQGVADSITGFGDAFLIPELVRDAFDFGTVDKCSKEYKRGKITGFAVGSAPFALRGAAYLGATRFGHPLLNGNRYLRIGPGVMRSNGAGLPAGRAVPRASVGPQRPDLPDWWQNLRHIDLRSRLPYVPPVSGPRSQCDCQ